MRPLCPALILALALGCSSPQANSAPPSPPPDREDQSPVVQSAKPDKPEPRPQKPKGYNEARIAQLYDLKKTKVTIGRHTFTCWIADEDSTRTEGLMFVTAKEIKDSEGMLFAFPNEANRSFWMSNTLIGLDIAYMKKDGTLVSVKTMKPLDETGVPSDGPAMYALEVKAGLFRKLGIVKGMKARIDPPVRGN